MGQPLLRALYPRTAHLTRLHHTNQGASRPQRARSSSRVSTTVSAQGRHLSTAASPICVRTIRTSPSAQRTCCLGTQPPLTQRGRQQQHLQTWLLRCFKPRNTNPEIQKPLSIWFHHGTMLTGAIFFCLQVLDFRSGEAVSIRDPARDQITRAHGDVAHDVDVELVLPVGHM